MLENYCKTVLIEANTMVDMARTLIAPAVEGYTLKLAKTAAAKKALDPGIVCSYENGLVRRLSALTDRIAAGAEELESAVTALCMTEGIIEEANTIRDRILPKMGELRLACDEAETLTAKSDWPFPVYGDLLFGVR